MILQSSDYVDPLGLDWIYQQSTGRLYYQPPDSLGGGPPAPIGSPGYSGHDYGLNNPGLEIITSAGPIPQGGYTIGPEQLNVTRTGLKLPSSMRLTPNADNWMYGRGGFLIHGDNSKGDRSASEGCIVLTKNIRDRIGRSEDNVLRVIP